ILDQNRLDLSLVHSIFKLSQSFAVEGHSRYIIVEALANDLVFVLLGIVKQYLPLVVLGGLQLLTADIQQAAGGFVHDFFTVGVG
ncbi:MAG: hypothetical protein NC203_07680, partial [Firmicutes bacterium]|nr:hypothetical protein [Bacillota bacterium]